MDLIRKIFDASYDSIKPLIFSITKQDPEKAHEFFVSFCQILYKSSLEKFILDNKTNKKNPAFKISNAAGFNRNAEIPITVLNYLGFDRVVIGTVTNKPWEGNKKPRCIRLTKEKSMLNWVGWESEGSEKVAKRLIEYEPKIPITINMGYTADPALNLKQRLDDVKKTTRDFKDIPCVDRFEYNPSCPNIHLPRLENQIQLPFFLEKICNNKKDDQEVYVKISPDIDKEDVEYYVKLSDKYPLTGFVTTNTTTNHSLEGGGGSGNMLHSISLATQKLFYEEIKRQGKNLKITACGGINSQDKLKERLLYGANEIQLYTPIIFSGTRLLRKLREI